MGKSGARSTTRPFEESFVPPASSPGSVPRRSSPVSSTRRSPGGRTSSGAPASGSMSDANDSSARQIAQHAGRHRELRQRQARGHDLVHRLAYAFDVGALLLHETHAP